MSDALKNQRTYALVGHGGVGKTSVAEMLLFKAGVISRLGKIEEGTSALDTEPEEIKRRGSIQPAFATYAWKKNTHFLIDTPGDNNFTGDIGFSLTAADGVVFTVDAVDGAKPLTKKLWDEVQASGLPAMIFINKMDRDRADFDMAFDSLVNMLGIKPVLLYMPIGSKEDFKGVVDVLGGKALLFDADGNVSEGEIPGDMADEVESLRETMVENIAEADEELMEKYLEEGELTPEEVALGMRAGVLSGELVPVACGSALMNMGGGLILDIVQDLFPSPLDHPAWQGEEAELEVAEDGPMAAFVFKTLADPFAGQLNVVRVLSGTFKPDSSVLNVGKDEKERVGQLLGMVGKEQKPIKGAAGPGAIVAIAKLKCTATGDTLCDEKTPFQFAKPVLAPSLISYALAPEEKGEEDKVYTAVHKLLAEDVCLNLHRDPETGDILLSGSGQLHIEINVERARRRSKTQYPAQDPQDPLSRDLQGQGRCAGPPQEAVRRPRPVRRLLHPPRAPAARRGLRVRGRDRGRLHPAPVHPGRGQGRPGGRRARRHRRVSGGGLQGLLL